MLPVLYNGYNLFREEKCEQKKGPSVETERPLTIACHMKKVTNSI